MESWKPTAISIHFDNLCREPVGHRPRAAAKYVFSDPGRRIDFSEMLFFEARKSIETQDELIEAVMLLNHTEGSA